MNLTSPTLLKFYALACLVIGEILSVYSEMAAAKSYSAALTGGLSIFSRNFAIIIAAGAFLIAGYMLGYSAFKNIWIVSVTSVTSILIVEPLLTYTIFHQLPSRGALIGLVLGGAGFIATLMD